MLYDKFLEIAVTTPTGATTHQENSFTKLLEPKLRKIFYETYDEVPEQYAKLFKINKSKKAQETDYGLGAFKPWTKLGTSMSTVADGNNMPSVNYQKIPAGLERIYTHEEFADGFMVERKFVDDEQYRIIEKMPADLARAGRYKVETDAASVFNNAFDNTNYKGYDNVCLISAAHPILNTSIDVGYGAGKASNLVEGALSDVTLKKATTLMRKQVDEAGKLIQMKPDTLVVPPDLEWLALELTKSAQKVGTSDNDINSLMGRFKVVVYDFLTDSDAWFIMDSTRHQLNFFWRVDSLEQVA